MKNSINTDHILKRILDVQIPVTVRELLDRMPELHQSVSAYRALIDSVQLENEEWARGECNGV